MMICCPRNIIITNVDNSCAVFKFFWKLWHFFVSGYFDE